MGARVQGVCYDTQAEAAQAICSYVAGTATNAGVHRCTGAFASDNHLVYDLEVTGPSGVPVDAQIWQPVMPCDMPMDWADGLGLGWAVAIVWIAVYAVTFIRKAADA